MNALAAWAAEQPDILGIAIVGSHARGTAKPGSDVDVVMIVNDPVHYLETSEWPERFGHTCSIRHEDWGLLQSKRVYYGAGREVEFGITTPAWARTDPIDPGTRQVVLDGIRVVYDRAGLFRTLVNSLTASSIDAPKPLRFTALIGGGLAICIGLLLLAFDPSPADRMAGVFIGVGVFFVVVGLVAPRLSHD